MPLNFGGHAGETEAARRIREEREAMFASNRSGQRASQGGSMGTPNGPAPLQYGMQSMPGMPTFGQPMGGGGIPGYGSALRNMVAPPMAGLSSGRPEPAMALGPLRDEGGGLGGALKGVLGGVGGAVGGAVDWLTDEDQGYLRQLLLSNAIGTAGSIYEANKRGAIEDEERERKERSRRSFGP